MVGHRFVVGAEGKGHGDTVAGCRIDVDTVVTDAPSRDETEVRCAGQDPFAIGLDAGDGGEYAGQRVDQLVFAKTPVEGVEGDLEAGLAQTLEAGLGVAIQQMQSNQDFFCVVHGSTICRAAEICHPPPKAHSRGPTYGRRLCHAALALGQAGAIGF